MHPLIMRFFKKKGIDGSDQLTPEEMRIYDQWNEILTKEAITIEELGKFVGDEIQRLTDKLTNPDISDKRDIFLKARIADYKAIQKIIQRPSTAKNELENYLRKLIK